MALLIGRAEAVAGPLGKRSFSVLAIEWATQLAGYRKEQPKSSFSPDTARRGKPRYGVRSADWGKGYRWRNEIAPGVRRKAKTGHGIHRGQG